MDCYLKKLASDETNSEDFANFLKSIVININKEAILEIIYSLKCKLEIHNIDKYFDHIKPHIISCKLKRSEILKTSHVFCEKCDLYVESPLCDWVKNNPELFETEIYFFFCFFAFFDQDELNEESNQIIENDLTSYSLTSFNFISASKNPISEPGDQRSRRPDSNKQTPDEKLKLLNTVIQYYEYLSTKYSIMSI